MPEFFGFEIHIWAQGIGFVFSLSAIILCSLQIHDHISHNHDPLTRKYIIRILFMVVVYSLESFCGLFIPSFSLYVDAIRDIYESVVIYSFYQLLIQSLGGYNEVLICLKLIKNNEMNHIFPFNCCIKNWSFIDNNNSFLFKCTVGILQYVILEPLCALIIFILQEFNVYHEGEFKLKYGYIYMTFIRCLSQTWAMYCLILFYYALKRQPIDSDGYKLFYRMRPIPKLLCIKGVVFFTYWQSVTISILVYMNIIIDHDIWTKENIAVGIQDLIICIEMMFFSIAHKYAFPINNITSHQYIPIPKNINNNVGVFLNAVNVFDVAKDAKHVLNGKMRESMSNIDISNDNNDITNQDNKIPLQ